MIATLLGIMISLSLSSSGLNIGENMEAKKYLLPGNIVPTNYDLEFYPDMDKFEFSNIKTYTGSAVITMRSVEDGVSAVVLNCRNPLKINEAVLLMAGKPSVSLENSDCDEETEKIVFPLKEPFKKNEEFKMKISFRGEHTLEQKGFFYLPTGVSNTSSFLLATHLQPNNARLVFPCFDEPKYKALVKITVGIPSKFYGKGYRVLSNGEEELVEENDGKHVFRFKTTPVPISTYLVAMVVSTYGSTPPKYIKSSYPFSSHIKPTAVRTWARPELLDKAEVPESFAQAILEIYTNNFEIELGSDKLDQFLMNTFLTGMENWGLITYPETLVTDKSRVNTARDIAHEICHQWFGNLVTTHSWTDIWLNEAFARYFEFFAAEKINIPEMDGSVVKYSYNYVVESLQGYALNEDSFDYIYPLTIDVYEPRQIWCYFDHIEYDKGSSFLRMVEHVLGEKPFYKALRHYLITNKNGVGTPDDLLSAFDYVSEESKSDLQGRIPSEIFRDWHLQEGYPVLHMHYADLSTNTIVLTQESFRIGDSKKISSYKWNIPISFSTNLSPNFTDTRALQWLWKDTPSSQINLGPDVEWIVINNLETGYYRVNYHHSNWMSIFHVLRNPDTMEQIHELNRAQIIDDAANLARSTSRLYLPYSFFMNLTTYLENETSYYAWEAAFNNFDYLYRMLSKDPKTYPLLKKHIIRIIRKQLKALSLQNKPNDTYQERQLRSEIVTWLSRMSSAECREEIQKLVQENSNHTMPGDIKTSASCLQVSTSEDSFSQNLYDKYLKADTVTERLSITSALACTLNETILIKLLKRTIDPNENVTDSEKYKIFSTILEARPENANLLLTFFYRYPLQVYLNYGRRKNYGSFLKKIAKGLGTDEELMMIKQLGNKIEEQFPVVLQCKSALPMVMEIVNTNNVWLKKRSEAVSKWLSYEYSSE